MLSKVEQSLNKAVDKLKGTLQAHDPLISPSSSWAKGTELVSLPTLCREGSWSQGTSWRAAAHSLYVLTRAHRTSPGGAPSTAGTACWFTSTVAAPLWVWHFRRVNSWPGEPTAAAASNMNAFNSTTNCVTGHLVCCPQETCLILPRCKIALDIGRCPQPSVFQQTVLISHGHLDHIGGVTFHAASRCAFAW